MATFDITNLILATKFSHDTYETLKSFVSAIVQKVQHIAELAFYLISKIYDSAFSILAYVLHPIARRGVMYTSSNDIKHQCTNDRFKLSQQALRDFGGKEIILDCQGNKLHAMHFSFKECIDNLITKGAVLDTVETENKKKQYILILPNQTLIDLITKMDIPVYIEFEKTFIHIPKPIGKIDEDNGTVIYAPGSGHLFEFRRSTIGTYVMDYGMNILVFHYSGTGKSEGFFSEEESYETMNSAYKYLTQEHNVSKEKILAYGHCAGAGPLLHLAEQHDLITFIDRSYTRMGEFTRLQMHRNCRLPNALWFLTAWVPRTMNKCFAYPNIERVKNLKKAILIGYGTEDKMIPISDINAFFEASKSAHDHSKIELNLNHDKNFGADRKATLEIRKFLKRNGLINSKSELRENPNFHRI